MRFLFIPVSGPDGIGEYMRSLILAEAVLAEWPQAEIAFILSDKAPYLKTCPYPVFNTPLSATQCSPQVMAILQQFKPDIAVFDCSGRAEQYRYAKRLGCHVIFISQHKKKRKRAFALNRIGNIDAHLITQFKFVDGDITWLEKLKLKLFNKPAPYFIGPVFNTPSSILPFNVAPPYVVFAAGGGGHKIDGKNAADILWETARQWHNESGEQCHVLLGPNYTGGAISSSGVICHKSLVNADLMALLKGAKCAVLGGGDMLSQAVALQVPTIAVAVAKDQPERIKAITKQQLTLPAQLEVNALLQALRSSPPSVANATHSGRDVFMRVIRQLCGF